MANYSYAISAAWVKCYWAITQALKKTPLTRSKKATKA